MSSNIGSESGNVPEDDDLFDIGQLLESEGFFPFTGELVPDGIVEMTIILLRTKFLLGIELIQNSLPNFSEPVLSQWKQGVLDKLTELNLSDAQKAEVELAFNPPSS